MAMATAQSQRKEEASGLKASPKRDAILKAATRVFLDVGYGAASMDTIAREAGVSKQTIYSHFGAKEVLYGAIIRDKCDQLMAPVMAPMTDTGPTGDTPETALMGIAVQFLRLVLAEENMANFRSIVAESGRFPELADAFYLAGPKLAVENLSGYLTALDGHGLLKVEDAPASARLFFAMLRGDLYMRRLLRIAAEPSRAEMEKAARQAVQVFLKAHAG